MNVEAVLDTNVLLYAASRDPADRGKSEIALGLIATVNFGVPLQVAQEFFHNARTKARLAIEPEHCDEIMVALLERPVVISDVELFASARALCRAFHLRYWDAAIVAAAVRLKAKTLYSEDLNDGQRYDGVRVINPFRDAD